MRIVIRLLAVVTAVFAARYLLVPPVWLIPPLPEWAIFEGAVFEVVRNVGPYMYEHHRPLLLLHISLGIVALITGLFQFSESLRMSRPRVHRRIGAVYLAAVFVAGPAALPLSFVILGNASEDLRPLFYPAVAAFATLSIAWTAVTAVAFVRVRQRRFDAHRDWMIRSYSLTFAAVTVRLVSPVLLLLSGDVAFAVNGGIWSWPVNLVVAEWLIRRGPEPRPGAVEEEGVSGQGLEVTPIYRAGSERR